MTLLSYEVPDADGRSNPPPGTQEDVLIHVRVDARNRIAKPAYGISVVNERGVLITSVNTENLGVTQPELPKGESTICVRINRTNFLPGYYTASFWVMSPQCHIYAMLENGITFEIAQGGSLPQHLPCRQSLGLLGFGLLRYRVFSVARHASGLESVRL